LGHLVGNIDYDVFFPKATYTDGSGVAAAVSWVYDYA
jgi:hypothetical protein